MLQRRRQHLPLGADLPLVQRVWVPPFGRRAGSGGPVGQLIDMTNRVSLLSATAPNGALGALGGGSGVVTGGSDGI